MGFVGEKRAIHTPTEGYEYGVHVLEDRLEFFLFTLRARPGGLISIEGVQVFTFCF
jgi:hypothetical protein